VSAPTEPIRSSAHPLLKRVRAVNAGKEDGVLLLEGDRLVDDALRAGIVPEIVLVAEERGERLAQLRAQGLHPRGLPAGLLAAVGSLKTSPGCLALAPRPAPCTVASLALTSDTLLVVAAGIQDPGNLGALARIAEAAGAGALAVTRGGCSPWNPKALRGSMGSVLRLPVLELEPDVGAVAALTRAGFRHVAARTRGGERHDRLDWTGRTCLWLSGETGELPAGLREAERDFVGVTIPMRGAVESLNVTTAAAVLLFAAGRTGGDA
jgi:TrmH family RNA methyltransferase